MNERKEDKMKTSKMVLTIQQLKEFERDYWKLFNKTLLGICSSTIPVMIEGEE